jgi:8-oxo-dGTP pyrophosphatase MutT (NUDIX family)
MRLGSVALDPQQERRCRRMDPTIRLPKLTAEGYAEALAGAAEPRNAASIILLRPGARAERGGLEVHLLRRHSQMPFAPDVLVFPGGGVDARDAESTPAWSGPSPDEWAAILQTDAVTAAMVVMAAARETFEESGILFAGASATTLVGDTSGDEWEADRQRLLTREVSFGQLLRDRGLTLRTDLLKGWSEWTTPVFEPRRFRTWFFVAELPREQSARDISGETSSTEWRSVADALSRAESGDGAMFPPQVCSCLELFEFTEPAAVIRSARQLELVRPTAAFDDDGAYLVLPAHFLELGRAIGAETHSG